MRKLLLGLVLLATSAGATNITPGVNITLVGTEGNTFTSSKTFTSDVLGKSSITASGFFGDGAGLTNLPSSGVCAAGLGADSVECSGLSVTVSGAWGVGAGGLTNNVTAPVAGTIGGGRENTVSADYGTVPGGRNNTVSGDYGFAAGRTAQADTLGCFALSDATGVGNTCRGVDHSFNTAFVGGHYFDGPVSTFTGMVVASSFNAVGSVYQMNGVTVIDRETNIFSVSSVTASAFFGDGSGLTGLPCVVGAGANSVLCQGSGNSIEGPYGAIGGGQNNSVPTGFVWGPAPNGENLNSVVAGGSGNAARSPHGFVGGGENNIIQTRPDNDAAYTSHHVISGGSGNSIEYGGTGGAISGGVGNLLKQNYGAIGGGVNNTINKSRGVIGGGEGNIINSQYSVIGGGQGNSAGTGNKFWAAIGGGFGNTSTGEGSTIPGGYGNIASGDYSFSAGNGSIADQSGCFVWSGGVVTSCLGIPNSFNVGATGGVFFDAPISTFTGTVTAAFFAGDGSQLTNLPGGGGENNTYTSSKTFTSDVLAKSSVTASGFFGDGSGLTNTVITTSSDPVHNTNIASVNYVGVSTATINARGGRPLFLTAAMGLSNSSGGERTYTCIVTKDGVPELDSYTTTIKAGDLGNLPIIELMASTAGSSDYAILCKSNNATGTQQAMNAHLILMEF